MAKTDSESEIPFGKIIRYHRKRAGLSQARLALVAGVGKTVVLDVEKGKRTVRSDILLRLLNALNVRLDWSSPLRAAFEVEQAERDA
jgi:HTH-type transcriptional regulator/antitoxin HipB